MSTISEQVSTAAPKAFWGTLKKYWAFGLLLILALMVFAMAKKDKIIAAFTTTGSTTKGDKLPAFLQRWLGVTTALVVFVGVACFGTDAYADVGNAVHVAQGSVFAAILDHWQWGLAALPALGMVGAPDVLDCKTENGGDSLTVDAPLAATTSRSLYVRSAERKMDKYGRPLVATDLTVEMATEITMTAGDDSVYDDDLARLFAYVGVSSPRMGILTNPEMHTGPVLDLAERFIGEGFERSGDMPVDTIAAPAADTAATSVIKYISRPFMQRWLDKPLTTCPWLPLLHNTNISIGVAADDCLTDVSTNADVSDDRVLKVSVSYQPCPVWFYPLVPVSRIDKPASGSNGLTFRGFGEAGPSCTQNVDLVHTIGHLSNLKGLPGNLTLDTITHLYGADFGLDDVVNVDHIIKARIRAQYYGRVFGVNYDGGNHEMGTTNAGGGVQRAALLFLLLKQPEIGMSVSQLPEMKGGNEMSIRYTTSSTRTGEDAFYIGSLRRVSPSKVEEWRKIEGGSNLPLAIGLQRAFNAK